MKTALLLLGLIMATTGIAQKPKVYHCQQQDGRVVIQDRRCQITGLTEVKIRPKVAKKLNTTPQNRPQSALSSRQIRKRVQQQSTAKNTNAARSPYFTFGWDRFIPANWQLHQIKTQRYEQLLLSRAQFKGSADFKEGVKLSVYADTFSKQRQGAFAQALDIYHRIRDNKSYTLLDSQFKTHPNYKVFNIKYLLGNKDLALTEFYIDENHNDLFVLTVQAEEASWLSQWQLAESIINRL